MPPQKRNTLNYLLNFLFLKDILLIIIAVGSFLTIIVLISWFLVQEEFANLASSAVAVDKEYRSQNEEVAKINKLSRELNTASKNFETLTPKLLELIGNIPDDIKLNYIHVDRQSQLLTISGSAKTRDTYAKFQDTLKNLSWITDLQVPATQLFIKDNINFDFSAKLKDLPRSHI